MSILDVKDLTHTYGDKSLFKDASMQLFRGNKIGLTGLNGAGKSTFINILIGEVVPDKGSVRWNPKICMGYLDQQAKIAEKSTVRCYLLEAFRALFVKENQLNELNHQIRACSDEEVQMALCEEAAVLQEYLNNNNFYAVSSTVDKVAAGLGITAFGMEKCVSELSGGQRAKVMLAKLLLENPDVLLLDEPTNFLDKEHIAWLIKYLQGFKGSFILVSHDFDFLDKVVNCICDIEFGAITRFNGSYESFVKQKESRREEYLRQYSAQQKQIEKLETFVEKNIARASTAGMAKSRRKQLEKIDRMDKPADAPKPNFLFRYTPAVGQEILKVNNLSIGYTEPLVPDLNVTLRAGSKLAVTGFNGIGKTTFIKTICGMLPQISGEYTHADNLKIGYFEQENIWENGSFTPIQELKNYFPRLNDKEVRSHLSRCGLRSDQMMQKLSTLSGGEQAKVKLCKLCLSPCGLLVLDEPTNHLDVNAIEQLKVALTVFEGTVLFVSHSLSFCESVADRFLDFEKLFD